MFQYVADMSLTEAETAFVRATRNMSFEQVEEIEKKPGILDDISPLLRYSRRIYRRIIELRDGVIYSEKVDDSLHHPV